MPSVKISELPVLPQLSANNANTIFVVVDKTTNTTSQFSTTVLAQGLYANNILNVGTANTGFLLPNAIAQFISNNAIYSQVNFQNINSKGSGDIVITSDDGDNSNNYLDLGVQGSNMDADPLFDLPNNDGYLYMHGTSGEKQGNLWIGTAVANTDLVFFTGAHKLANEIGRFEDGVGLSLRMPIKFVDGTTQNTAASAAAVTLAAQANTIITQGVDATQNTNITAVNNFAASAFTKANNALANTTGSFNGNLNISNNLTVNGTIVLANTNFATTETAFRITGVGSSQNPTQSGTLMQLTSKQNTPARVLIDSIGTSNTSYSIIAGRTARGTVDTPTATQNNDILLRIAGNSYGTTGYAPFGDARIDFVASENRSDTARGSRIRFWNTPNGSNVINEIASFNGDSVTFTGTVAPIKGFIYTPNIYSNAQTAVTISFSDDSVVRAQTSAGLVVTLSSFVVGKSVEAWITNTAGTGQTFTHGCSAINSTVNSTTYSIPSTSSIFVKYWCMDGTLANTFVAITHT